MNVRKKKSLNKFIEEMVKDSIDHEYDSGGVIWVVRKHEGEEPDISCIYIEWDNESKSWYDVSDISEMEGPAALTCPLRFFPLAPVEFPEWREEVRKYHKGGPSVQCGDVPRKLADALRRKN